MTGLLLSDKRGSSRFRDSIAEMKTVKRPATVAEFLNVPFPEIKALIVLE